MYQHAGSVVIEILVGLAIFMLFFSQTAALLWSNQTVYQQLETRKETANAMSAELALAANWPKETEWQNKNPDENRGGGADAIQTITHGLLPCLERYSSVNPPTQMKQERLTAWPQLAMSMGRDCESESISISVHNQPLTAAGLPALAYSTDLDVIFFQNQTYAIVATNGADMGDLWVFNLSSWPPKLVANIEVGPGLNALDAAWVGDALYVFAASNDSANQFLSIQATPINAPVLISSRTLPDVGNSYPQGWSIHYFNQHIFLGVRETAGAEIHEYNVQQPAAPKHLNKLEINHNVNALLATDAELYLATSSDAGEIIRLSVQGALLQSEEAVNVGRSRHGDSDAVSLTRVGGWLLVGNAVSRFGDVSLSLLDISGKLHRKLSELTLGLKVSSRIKKIWLNDRTWYAGIAYNQHWGLIRGQITLDNRLQQEQQWAIRAPLRAFDQWGSSVLAVNDQGEFVCFGCAMRKE